MIYGPHRALTGPYWTHFSQLMTIIATDRQTLKIAHIMVV
jgi:hypothetical protein